jgi:putative membrane protein
LFFGLVVLALFVAAVAVVVAWLRRHEPSGSASRAEVILANRYAAGELDDEEFERRRSVLRR